MPSGRKKMHKEENPTGVSAILETQQGFRFRHKGGGNGDTKPGMWYTPLTTSTEEAEAGREISEFEASLACIQSSSTARATQ